VQCLVALRPIFLATHTVGDDLYWTNFDSGSIDEMYPLDLWPVKALRKAPSPTSGGCYGALNMAMICQIVQVVIELSNLLLSSNY